MGRRERIKGKPKAWADRGRHGRFVDWHNIQRSLAIDKRIHAKRKVSSGLGHLGDIHIKGHKGWFGQRQRHRKAGILGWIKRISKYQIAI